MWQFFEHRTQVINAWRYPCALNGHQKVGLKKGKFELAAKFCTHSHLFTQNRLKLQNKLQHVRPLGIIEHAAAYLFR